MFEKLILVAALLSFSGFGFAFDAPQYEKGEPHDDRRIVGMECHKKNNTLEVGYFTDSNLPDKRMDLWDTFDLKKNKKDSDYVESIHEIVRKCKIGNDLYLVKFRPVPGNWNLNGECGGATYGGAKIMRNGVVIFDKDFEGCNSKEIISKVRISTDQKDPVVTIMTRKEYYGW